LICGIAAKAANAEADVVAHQVAPVGDQALARRRVFIVQLSQVLPLDHRAVRLLAAGRNEVAVRVAQVPVGMLLDQHGILGGMVDHQVHHHADPVPVARSRELAQPSVPIFALRHDQRVVTVVVLYGVKAAGEARQVKGIDEDPVELHAGDTRQFAVPVLDRSAEQREEVVEAWAAGHGWLALARGVSRVAELTARETSGGPGS
jgi:hypothetical protein